MKLKILIDMNLSPSWVSVFEQAKIEAVHWFSIGSPQASDHEIMKWALSQGYCVFTHDLDFGAILAATGVRFPSVIQVRSQDVSPAFLKERVLKTLQQYQAYLQKGALITIDESRSRVKILPI